jgi:hypothetical protein
MLHDGLGILLEVFRKLKDDGPGVWKGAVSWLLLRDFEMTIEEVRLLLEAGVLDLQLEMTRDGDGPRLFQRVEVFTGQPEARLILTATGADYASRLLTDDTGLALGLASRAATGQSGERKPQWKEATGNLLWLGQVVKHFRIDAFGPRRVFAEFERLLWCQQILNPQPQSQVKRKKQTQNLVARLNHGMLPGTLRFHAAGCKISWEALM